MVPPPARSLGRGQQEVTSGQTSGRGSDPRSDRWRRGGGSARTHIYAAAALLRWPYAVVTTRRPWDQLVASGLVRAGSATKKLPVAA
jgi:hypothetical protein